MVEQISVDVLVIGGGLAGLRAAVEAATLGRRVLLVSKTEPGTDNCSAAAGGHLSGAVGGRDEAGYLGALQEYDGGRADSCLQRILAYDSGAALTELLQRFEIEANVKHGTLTMAGPARWWGRPMTQKLAAFARNQGVEMRWPICVSRLLMHEDACVGAIGLDLESGATVGISAKATVLCGGGHSAIYPRHDNPGAPMGDCVLLALHAGARVRDMGFCKFHTVGLAEGPEPQDILASGLALAKARFTLEDGTPIERRELAGIWEGRASGLERDDARFDALADMTHLDWDGDPDLAAILEAVPGAAPARERPVRVSPLAHYTPGGIGVDAHGWTGVTGLYAAGECTGGVFGADRPGGAALTDCVVFGRRAGNEAARVCRDLTAPVWPDVDPIDLDGSDNPGPLRDEARWLMWNYSGFADTPDGLILCARRLSEIAEIAREMRPAGIDGWQALHALHCVSMVGNLVARSRCG
ncbi:MAG: FAD-binding protein [Armatimonadetes bacterium]|nr:FAD-binding protein [Armatimonadota bacterium]